MVKIKDRPIPSIDMDVEERNSNTKIGCRGNVKWYNHLRKYIGSFLKVNIPQPYDPNHSTAMIFTQEKLKHASVQKLIHKIHGNFICNNQRLETTQMSSELIDGWINHSIST